MKFESILERDSGWVVFKFTKHDAVDVCCGDQIWSNGQEVQIYDGADKDVIYELINQVENKTAFKGALRRMELLR